MEKQNHKTEQQKTPLIAQPVRTTRGKVCDRSYRSDDAVRCLRGAAVAVAETTHLFPDAHDRFGKLLVFVAMTPDSGL
jgi:hypothetical protein